MLKKQNLSLCALLVLFLFFSSTNRDVFSDSPNMIVNGDFASATSGWNLFSQLGGEAYLAVERGELHVNIRQGGECTYSINLNQTGLTMEQGLSYEVSFKARSASGTRNIWVKVGLAGEPWTLYSEFKTYLLTAEKKNYAFKFTMLEPTDPDAYIEFQLGTNDIDVYLDEIILKKIDVDKIVRGAKLPPTGKVTRKYPKLVNYFHTLSFEGQVVDREERLAQWDVLIIPHFMVKWMGVSLSKIRKTNPHITLLVYIPFGQEPAGMDVGEAIPGENDPHNWYGKTVTGKYMVPHWGGHLMNPYKHNFAYPKHVINFVKTYYLDTGLYDGVMFDILAEGAPTFASTDNPPTFDTDEDGDFNEDDHKKYNEGVLYLLKNLREKCPNAILTGNGGIPWTKNCPYYKYANGDMHENALGNEFGSYYWDAHYGAQYPQTQPWLKGIYGTWDGYKTCIDEANPYNVTRFHFISVDVRMNRSQEQAESLQQLTADDLRRMRLGLGTSLLEDGGYFGYDRGDCLHGQLWWFDEYDADLGNPLESYKTGAYGQGNSKKQVYSRKFEHGIVIVNNNSAQTVVTLEAAHKDVTTKKTGTQFTIPPYDARIFVKD
ncbi:MAG: carbohydrate binding domain-containing protein [Spirochaetales bacterium]|nr:carbohydrate binding domain-containing protein [Spirochaetales bacterium]